MPDPRSLVGKIIGGFVIQSQLGAGGMGVVYKAHDERLGRTVAIKVLPSHLRDDDTLRQRFLREGRTAARIDHPHVARILTAGEEGEVPYLVMEYVDGGSLQRYLEKNRSLPLKAALRITRQVGAALAAAHRAGVLHRDVKPANVLFTRDAQPKLVDFGLAREEDADVHLSVTGQVMGTPHYMAPEVCRGNPADARSDLYSLAIMAYVMISGRMPFDGKAAVEILLAHLQYPLPPLPEAPPAVAAVIAKALAKNAELRHAGVEEFVRALEEAEAASGLRAEGPAAPDAPAPVPPPESAPRGASRPGPPSGPRSGPPAPAANPELGETPASPMAAAAATPPTLAPAHGGRLAYALAAVAIALSVVLVAVLVWAGRRNPARPAPSPGPAAATSPAEPVPPTPGPDLAAWEATLRGAQAEASKLAEAGDFRRALKTLDLLSAPSNEQGARVARERNRIMALARTRLSREVQNARAGPEGARALRALGTSFPTDMEDEIEAEARRVERAWTPEDDLSGLLGLFSDRDWDRAERELARFGDGRDDDERSKLEVARRIVRHGRLSDQAAMEAYEKLRGQEIELERADGTRLKARMHAVPGDGRLLVVADGAQLALPLRELAGSELYARICGDAPTDAQILAAIDVAGFGGDRTTAWRAAASARRRGLELLPAQRDMLDDSVREEEWKAFEKIVEEMDGAHDDPAKAADLGRRYQRKYRWFPGDAEDAQAGRELMRIGGGPAGEEDLRLYTSARVRRQNDRFLLDFPLRDDLLDDFAADARLAIRTGPGFVLHPDSQGTLWLPGLFYDSVTLLVEVRPEPGAAFAILTHAVSPFESVSSSLAAENPRRGLVHLPTLEEPGEAQPGEDGWYRLSVSASGHDYSLTVNGATKSLQIPFAPAGQVGFWLSGPVAIRRLEIAGNPEFREPDLDGDFHAVLDWEDAKGRKLPGTFGAWTRPESGDDRVTVRAGETPKLLAPPQWEAGDDYMVKFRVKLNRPEAMLLVDFRRGEEIARRLVVGREGVNGFVSDGKFAGTGGGAAFPQRADDFVEATLVVRGGLAGFFWEGQKRPAWLGHCGLAEAGGVALGVAGGQATFKDLEIRPLKQEK